jgi:hypothetical protein
MVMTRQQPQYPHQHRNSGYKQPLNGGDQVNQQYNDSSSGDNYNSSSSTHRPTISAAARARTSPPTVPAAAAAASSKKLSLYEELLQYHSEHPDDELSDGDNNDKKARKAQELLDASTDHSSVEDRKPAARPQRPPSSINTPAKRKDNATFRMPLDRAYFEQKQDLSPPGRPTLGVAGGTAESPIYQQSSLNLTEDWEDDPCKQSSSNGRDFYSEGDVQGLSPKQHATILSSLVAPFPDSFQDLAEDEALARQLQAEEEEQIAKEKATKATAAKMTASPRQHKSYTIPPEPATMPYFEGPQPTILDREEALAQQLAALSVAESNDQKNGPPFHSPQHEIVLPATLVHEQSSSERATTQREASIVSSPMRNPPRSSSFIPTTTSSNPPSNTNTPSTRNTTDLEVIEMTADEIAKQESILRDIREAQEREQLEWALRESSSLSANHYPLTNDSSKSTTVPVSDDWQARQRAAFEEFERKQREAMAQPRQQPQQQQQNHHQQIDSTSSSIIFDCHSTTGSVLSVDSALVRGRQETEEAIRTGQAHVVRCHGCSSRLRAPTQYNLVYCPRCGHVSPVE